MTLANYFREILDTYPLERTKEFKRSDFAQKFSKNTPKEFPSLKDFSVKASCGKNNWALNPWISITHDSFDSSQESLQIEYSFDCENCEVHLSLVPRLEIYSEYTSFELELISILKTIDLNDFTLNYYDDSYSIIDKKYSYDELDDTKLTTDLDFLVSIYARLQKEFTRFIKIQKGEAVIFAQRPLMDMEYRHERAFYSRGIESSFNVKDIEFSYPIENTHENSINSAEELFTDENIEKIIRCDITITDYKNILDNITQSSQLLLINAIKINSINLNQIKTKDKVLLFAKSFADITYKSRGRLLGSYAFNKIKIDDRLASPLIITSIIHELTHFIVEKILKEILMKILDTDDTPLISSYIKMLLEDDLNYLMDEFCAHTVEGRFALFGFQDYSSFNYKLDEISHLYSKEDIDYCLLIANTLAYDINDIFEKFIDEDLREDIKDEFLSLNMAPNYEQLDLEIDSRLDDDNLIEAFGIVLTSGIGETLSNPQKLERYMAKFSRKN
ncbi:MrcB family domain-containing protein [Methanobrevibacter sp.]|uniref:MrcB family domain-containing protein n=1 Tax=Methanobrevibacter sp. TaxID=66852 RepID=UPI0025DEE90F|nr:DUF3578 domain-containing protein [Methanobrevibacter sp.]